jgi:glycerol-3-phosphate dehydrogenase (NAD(P)+)
MSCPKPQTILVIGAGSFGTALANLWSKAGHDVTLWSRNTDVLNEVKSKHTNKNYTDDQELDHNLKTEPRLEQAVPNKNIIVSAIPCQYSRHIWEQIQPHIQKDQTLMNVSKGMEISSQSLPHQVAKSVFGNHITEQYTALSGPTFAKEILEGKPTGAVIASQNADLANKLRDSLSCLNLRLYSQSDVLGVELGGALKNIMAIAVGVSDGLALGHNTRAGLMTRCLHEMISLGTHMGAKPETFSGLSGIGDLILTCTGHLSRNRQVGLSLGQGQTIEEIKQNSKHLAEGVPTTQAVYDYAKKEGLELPNINAMYSVLYKGEKPADMAKKLFQRELKSEF